MLITIFLGPKFIDFLRVREFGQQIREEGPQEHHAKAGTPTMGGLIVFLAIAVPYLVLSDRDTASLAVFGVALGCASLGFADDFIKISKRRSLGLSARYKLLAQIALALALWWVAYDELGLDPVLESRIFDTEIYLGPVALPAVRLPRRSPGPRTPSTSPTASTASPRAPARSSCSPTWRSRSPTARTTSRCSPAASSAPRSASCGSTRSRPRSSWATPARSASGGAIGAFAVMTQTELLLIILGGIFVIEALSVAVQVISFKMFRRRVLLMAPVHHHFELLAWSETKIMLRFWIVAAVCSGIGYVLYQNSIGS